MATYVVQNAGNLAIECHIWTLPLTDAKRVLKDLGKLASPSSGSYEYSAYARPIRQAIRAKRDATLRTAGFSTGEFANRLAALGIQYRQG